VAAEEICLANLGRRERGKRLATGIAGFLGGGALAAWFLLAGEDAPAALYFLVFVPFLVGALGLFQALAGT
jgi:hypothetical protein